MADFDRTDRAILETLQRNGRTSNVELAAAVHLSESACLRRVRQLEDSGVIGRYAMLVEDGVVRVLNVEDAPSKADLSGAETLLKSL